MSSRALILASWACIATAASAQIAPFRAPVDARWVELLRVDAEIDRLTAVLDASGNDQESLDHVARLIAHHNSDAARVSLLRFLTNPGNAPARLAVARALADIVPDPAFVDPLFALMDRSSSPALLESASAALRVHNADPTVTTRLLALTESDAPALRVASASALWAHAERRVVDRLVAMIDDPSEVVARQASQALRELTGEERFTSDDWNRWHQRVADIDPLLFREQLLLSRSARLERINRQIDRVLLDLRRQLQQQYASAGREERVAMLKAWLGSPRATLRGFAAEQVASLARTLELSDELKPLLVTMLSDHRAEIRLQIARALRDLNEAGYLNAVEQASLTEREPSVRQVLVEALARSNDATRLPSLIRMLDDPSREIEAVALSGITRLAPQLDPAGADALTLARRLETLLKVRSSRHDERALVDAAAALRHPSLVAPLVERLEGQPSPSGPVRVAIVLALGSIDAPGSIDRMMVLLNDDDVDVRLAALASLDRAASLDRVTADPRAAQSVLDAMDPAIQPAPAVRQRAGELLPALARRQDDATLNAWSSRLMDQPASRLAVLEALVESARRADDRVALVRRLADLAETLRALARPADAADAYELALKASDASGNPQQHRSLVVRAIATYLEAGELAQAVTLLESLDAGESSEEASASVIASIERLLAEGRLDAAANLADMSLLSTGVRSPANYERIRQLLIATRAAQATSRPPAGTP
jgi:HEAT repeat protein